MIFTPTHAELSALRTLASGLELPAHAADDACYRARCFEGAADVIRYVAEQRNARLAFLLNR